MTSLAHLDTDNIFTAGLAQLPFTFLGQYTTTNPQPILDNPPDILTVEPKLEPWDLIKQLKAHNPNIRCIPLAHFLRDNTIDKAYWAGAWGFLLKRDNPLQTRMLLEQVADGQPAFSDDVLTRLVISAGQPVFSQLYTLNKVNKRSFMLKTNRPIFVLTTTAASKRLGITDKYVAAHYICAEGIDLEMKNEN